MPYLKSKGKVRASRTFKRRVRTAKRRFRKITKPLTSVSLGQGFPKKLCVTHKYVESFALASTAGVPGVYAFSCNGMYDPNISGTGHQPFYFDQLSALYDQYTVIASKCVVRLSATSTSGVPFYCTLSINDDVSQTSADPSVVAETQQSSFPAILQPGGNNTVTLSKRWSAKKFFGGSVMSNNSLQGTTAANPSEQSYFFINTRPVNGSDTATIYAEVVITYIAVWNELKDVAVS